MKDIILVLLIAVVIDSLVVFLSYYWRNLQRAKQVKRNRQLLLNISAVSYTHLTLPTTSRV